MFDPFDTPAFNAIVEKFNEVMRKALNPPEPTMEDDIGWMVDHYWGLWRKYHPTAAMFDFGFLCRHGAPYMGCPSCANEASEAADNLVRCPWCKGTQTKCSACKGTGYVEAI